SNPRVAALRDANTAATRSKSRPARAQWRQQEAFEVVSSLAFPAHPGRNAFDPPLSDGWQNEAPGNHVSPAIVVQVAASHRDQTDRSCIDRPHLEILMPVVLQPYHAGTFRVAPVVAETDQHDVRV